MRYSSNNFFEKWSVGRNFPPLKHEKRRMVIMLTRVGKLPILIQRLKTENTHRTRARGWLIHLLLIFHKVAGGGLLSKPELWAKGGRRSWITPHNENKNQQNQNLQKTLSNANWERFLFVAYDSLWKLFSLLCDDPRRFYRHSRMTIHHKFFQTEDFSKNVTFPYPVFQKWSTLLATKRRWQRISAHDQLLEKASQTFFP